MTTDLLNCAYDSSAKRIKLDNEYVFSGKQTIQSNTAENSVKAEPNTLIDYLSPYNLSKDSSVKFYPILSVSEEPKNRQNCATTIVNSNILSSKQEFGSYHVNDDIISTKSLKDANLNIRPSESLFVRCLLPRCKRLAPLWFKGVSSMREKNREEHKRISASNTCQTQNEWERISNLISEMNESSETETVVNLLKKLYKELPSDSVLWFIKCWLKFPEARDNEHACVYSRGDAKGKMRRIDGGKGSDKVWRLDTIVGMMFHGMPMSSTDTNIMVHTCDHELCIRPQHLRFRASSVAFVAVLKALQQTGYSIIPPADDAHSINGGNVSPCDEFVDISGPFNIEQLQQYRLEELKPCEQSMGKLNCSSSDISLLEVYPVLKNYYPMYAEAFKKERSDKKSRRDNGNELKRPAKTTSNSTGSPPLMGDGLSHQCQSPPNLTGVKSLNTDIAPTPRKFEMNHTYKISEDSPSSSSIYSREKEPFGQAPDLMAEEPYDIRPSIAMDLLSRTSRLSNESPMINGSTNGSGKNTPRQPAKKRLEARTPTLMDEDQPDTLSSVSSPLDNKLGNSSTSVSAFRIVPKKSLLNNDEKPFDELTEVEVAEILDPCSSFPNDNYRQESHYQSSVSSANDPNLPNGNHYSQLDMRINKANESLTTPSPLDCLFMAISQNPNLSVPDERTASIRRNSTCSPAFDNQKAPLAHNDCIHGYRMPLKSSAAAISCRFTPEQASVLLNVIRNSPYGNNNPEIVDILFNMMQQYPCMGDCFNGDYSRRPDSRILRRQIYQQLSKASPQFDFGSSSPFLNELSNEDGSTVPPCQFQNPPNKVVFNTPRSTPKNYRISSTDT